MTQRQHACQLFYDTSKHIITLKFDRCAETYVEDTFVQQLQESLYTIQMQGHEWSLLIDLKACTSQSPRIWRMAAHAIRLAKAAGMKKKAVLAYRLNPSFYHDGYVQDTEERIDFYFQSEHEALRWLAQHHTHVTNTAHLISVNP
jgi:hypothetical protein